MSEFVVSAGRGLTGLLLIAFLQGWKKGRDHVGTEQVLETFSIRYPPMKRALRPVIKSMRARIAGEECTPWRSLDADHGPAIVEVDAEVEAVLREVTHLAKVQRAAKVDECVPAWTGGVRAAVRAGLHFARLNTVCYANPFHLVMGLCADHDNRATELLQCFDIAPEWVLSIIPQDADGVEDSPHSAAALVLERNGLLTVPRSRIYRMVSAVIRTETGGWRRGGLRPIVMAVDVEAARQAVRRGASRVNRAHYLLALCALHDQLDQLGLQLADRWKRHNDAGLVLSQYGVTEHALATRVGDISIDDEPLEDSVPPWRGRVPASLRFGIGVIAAVERAQAYATELGHAYAGTSHILIALLADEDGLTRRLLRDLGVDGDSISRDLISRLAA